MGTFGWCYYCLFAFVLRFLKLFFTFSHVLLQAVTGFSLQNLAGFLHLWHFLRNFRSFILKAGFGLVLVLL